MTATTEKPAWSGRLHGWVIHSAIPLHELVPEPDLACCAPDVRIELGNPVERQDPATPQVEGGGGEFRLVAPGVADFHVLQGRSIQVLLRTGANQESLRALLLGPVWAALCYQRRELLLHASACRRKGRTLLFCGRSGAGKSSLLAAMVRAGWQPLADDTCLIRFQGDGPPLVFPGIPQHRLWPEALDRLGLDRYSWKPLASDTDKIASVWAHPAGDGPQPAGGIFLLDWGPLQLKRVTGLQSVDSLLRSATYFPSALERIVPLAEYTERLIGLLRTVPVCRLRRPRDWARLEETVELLRQWSEHCGKLMGEVDS